MEVTQVNVQDGKLVAERPILQDSQIADVGYVLETGNVVLRDRGKVLLENDAVRHAYLG